MTIGTFITGSLRDPAGAAAYLRGLALDRGTILSLMALITILSVLILMAGVWLSPAEAAMFVASPFSLTILLGGSLIMLVLAVHLGGRLLGGSGRIEQAVLLIVWWQAMALVIQVIQTVLLLILPVLSSLAAIAGLVWLVFALLHLVNVLHAFNSLWKALGTVIIGVFTVSLGLGLLLALIGVSVGGVV
ncbi:Yip1 domain-containing protein [Loktanella fryxellensis]|uniref:Yip1 domain-containing protein n=1 Tax=Loktanella fryxellensis TaxID=245187 RepID=A0A1H8F8F8_9RHOB|nr:YIP1 family protein [Loktanella fryxellensis]SEN27816.1 Yip1 domain-containing protein [Loktanella fryxellensis]